MNSPANQTDSQIPSGQDANTSQAKPQLQAANEAPLRNRKNTRGTLPPMSTITKAFLVAAAGALGSYMIAVLGPILWTQIHPPPKDPYAYLIGRYKGQWYWNDPTTHQPTNTFDIVHIVSTTNGQLIGHGDDYNLGSYDFSGTVSGNDITADYTNYPGENEPSQQGQFFLYPSSTKPLILEGKWNGFFNGHKIIEGTAKLTRDDPTEKPK